MNSSYQAVEPGDSDAFWRSGALSSLAKVDAVVFDCDGTLVDVRESYDATIIKTASSMVKGFSGRSVSLEKTGGELIMCIRRTGGFNSDWDVTYALSLFAFSALEGGLPRGVNDRDGATTERLKLIVGDFASKERLLGWRSVDQYLASSRLESGQTAAMRRHLRYPGNPLTSRLAAAFDQTYYGEGLYRRIYGASPEVAYKKGLIDHERVIITEGTLSCISEMVGGKRIGMATGRPYVAVEHALGRLLDYFDRDASVYIGDGDIFPDLALKLSKFKKPSGEGLILAGRKFSSNVLLYVGDSAEDRLMAENARSGGRRILFAGIYGSSFDDKAQISYFTGSGADLIVKDVNQIPKVLELARD